MLWRHVYGSEEWIYSVATEALSLGSAWLGRRISMGTCVQLGARLAM